MSDARTLDKTADSINRKIIGTVEAESRKQLISEQTAIAQQTALKEQTGQLASSERSILLDVNRSMNPLKDVRITYFAHYDFGNNPELKAYRDRLDSSLRSELSTLANRKNPYGTYASATKLDGTVETVTMSKGDPAYPNRERESFAWTVLNTTDVSLTFYKRPVHVSQFGKINRPRPDIQMSFGGDEHDDTDKGLEYDLNTKDLVCVGFNVSTDPKYWNNSGSIVSMMDLPGTQMFISLGHLLVSFDEPDRSKRAFPILSYITFQIGDRREWTLRPGRQLRYLGTNEAETLYVYQFPNTIQEVLKQLDPDSLRR